MSFSLLVGGECGCDSRSRILSSGILPLVSCNKSVSGHKKLLKFSGCETEVELILARSASLFSNTAEHPGNDHMSLAP